MSRLFRPEAIDAQRQAWLGHIQLVRPVSLSLLSAGVVLAAVAVGLFLCLGEYTRKARISGHLVPDRGVLPIVSPQVATVLERHVREGQAVRQGELLFVLSLERSTPHGDTQEAVQTSLAARQRSLLATQAHHTELQQSQAQGLQRQLDARQHELGQLTHELQLQQQRWALAQQALARLESLRDEHFVSAAQVHAKAEEVLSVRAQLQALERERVSHQREIGALQAQLRELPLRLQASLAEVDRELAELAQEAAQAEAQRRLLLRAPQDGVVTAVLAEPGQPTPTGGALANLVPVDAQLQAHLYAPSSAIGFVQPDQAVLLRFEAFPYQKFGHHAGRVLQVSRTPLPAAAPGRTPAPGQADEPMYRITVALERQTVTAYGQPHPLSPGLQLDADVLLERRRLIEWIFEPMISIAGRV